MSELETILKEVLFSTHLKQAREKAVELFTIPYNYLVWTPAAPYFDKLTMNFTERLVQSPDAARADCESPKPKRRKKGRSDDDSKPTSKP
jgi:hypothetical protein